MENTAKPFIKWAGGKTQLLDSIDSAISDDFKMEEFTYIEPFVGGGAFLFFALQKYPNLKQAIINDINTDLTNTYLEIKENVFALIDILKKYEKEYHTLKNNLGYKYGLTA